jgi:hypothetical protein
MCFGNFTSIIVQILVFLNMTSCFIGGHRRLEEHIRRNVFLRNKTTWYHNLEIRIGRIKEQFVSLLLNRSLIKEQAALVTRVRAGPRKNWGSSPSRGKKSLAFHHGIQTGCEAHPASDTMAIDTCTPRVKRQERESDHSFPFSPDSNYGRAISPFPHTSSWISV